VAACRYVACKNFLGVALVPPTNRMKGGLTMNEIQFVDFLQDLLFEYQDNPDDPDENFKRVQTFREVGMLTKNEGLVVKMADGSEFQITIVQSEYASDEEEEK
jgi:hypothetical protein